MSSQQDSKSSIESLGLGDHVCLIYQTKDEHRQFLQSFLIDGIRRNEKIIYLNSSTSVDTVLNYLREAEEDVDSLLEKAQLRIISAQSVYLRKDAFDPGKMMTFIKIRTEQALDEGFSGLRITSDMGWVLKGKPGSLRLIEYEAKLSKHIKREKCLIMCQYNRCYFNSPLLLYAIATHPVVAVGTKISENPFYLAPPAFLGQDDSSKVLNFCLNRLTGSRIPDDEFGIKQMKAV